MQRLQLRALRDAPGVKLVAVVKIETRQEFPPEPTGQRTKIFARTALQRVERSVTQIQQVDSRTLGVESDALPVGYDPSCGRLVHEPAQLAQAPAQCATRIVRQVP